MNNNINNIFHKIGNKFHEKAKRDEEIKQIPKDFWMDLNELDFKKYEASRPHNNYLCLNREYMCYVSKLIMYGFLFYVIVDFMNYAVAQTVVLNIARILLRYSPVLLLFLLMFFIVDFIDESLTRDRRNNHDLVFYRRLQKYKKGKGK